MYDDNNFISFDEAMKDFEEKEKINKKELEKFLMKENANTPKGF